MIARMATTPLPLVDVRSVDVAASSVRCWRAVTGVMSESMGGAGARAFAVGVGCPDRDASGRPDEVGSAFAGFHVVRSEPPFVWTLEGCHRFSTYLLEFRVRSAGPSRSVVQAESRARFPGVLGAVYRTAVIRSGGHAMAVGRLLARVKAAAETG
jgi:hypothetical protein